VSGETPPLGMGNVAAVSTKPTEELSSDDAVTTVSGVQESAGLSTPGASAQSTAVLLPAEGETDPQTLSGGPVPSGTISGGGQGASTPTFLTSTKNSSKSSGVNVGEIGGIIAAIFVLFIIISFIILRWLAIRRRKEQVRWMEVDTGSRDPELGEIFSVRTSWWSTITPPGDTDEKWPPPRDQPRTVSPARSTSDVAPVVVIPPTRTHSPEDPFSDSAAATAPEPSQTLLALPLRISLISPRSETEDPFDDSNATTSATGYIDSLQEQQQVSVNRRRINNIGGSRTSSEANFPIPPSTVPSSQLPPNIGKPGVDLHIPDSSITQSPLDLPVASTFEIFNHTYPRQTSAKQTFYPSQEMPDEITLEEGDAVRIVTVYEDGWAFVQKMKGNGRGLVPLICLDV